MPRPDLPYALIVPFRINAPTSKKINPEHVEAVIRLFNEGPYFRLLSMEVKELRAGYSRIEVDLDEKHLNPFGGVHGGVYSSLIDTATYCALYCSVEEGDGYISLDLQVDNLAAAKLGHVIVEGKVIKAGRSICKAEAFIMDEEGRHLAHGTSKQMVTPGLQTIGQAMDAMGHEALPPKFLP